MLRSIILAAVAMAGLHAAVAADISGTITILEGEALVYRGMGRVHAVEGLRLAPGDILETGAKTFTQVELVDQSVAEFGGATRVMFNQSGGRGGPQRWMYMMDGWAKLSGTKRAASSGPGFELRTPVIEIAPSPGVVVVRESPKAVEVFAESGELQLAERQATGAPVGLPMKGGDFYTRRGNDRGVLASAPAQTFLAEVPRSFRDSIPSRLERFRSTQVKLKDAPEFAYSDVEAWLKAEPSVRRPLMQRWRGKARDPAFRSALIANLSAHPEWDPILFPEKYKPKEPPPHPVARAPAVAVVRPASAPVAPTTPSAP